MQRVFKSASRLSSCFDGIGLRSSLRYRFSTERDELYQNKENPCWIRTISYEDSEGKLRTLYDRIKGPEDNVDNIMLSHSLRPHTLEAHMHSFECSIDCVFNTVNFMLYLH